MTKTKFSPFRPDRNQDFSREEKKRLQKNTITHFHFDRGTSGEILVLDIMQLIRQPIHDQKRHLLTTNTPANPFILDEDEVLSVSS